MKIYAAMSSGFVPASMVELNEYAEQLARHRLFSYHYHGASSPDNEPSVWVKIAAERGCTMFLDSGAFSAHWLGIEINIDKYAEYINKTAHMWDIAANLDVIGGTEQQNWDNLKALESNGCKVCPVYHVGEDQRWLKKMVDNYEYVLLGGLVVQRKSVIRELDRAYADILTHPNGTARVKLHGFGMTQLELIFRYPWESVDATSWMLHAGFGFCTLYGGGEEFVKVTFSDDSPQKKIYDSNHYDRLSAIERARVDQLIAPSGFTVEQLRASYTYRRVLNLWAYDQLERNVNPVFKNYPLTLKLF